MNHYGGDLRRLVAIFHSPRRTFAGIGETPGVAVVTAALFGCIAVAIAARVIPTEGPPGIQEATSYLLQPLLAIGWPFFVSALYVFVFDLFGAEARYRVILSVSLHAMWAVFAFATVSSLLWRLVSNEPAPEVSELLISSFGVDGPLARELGFMLDPLEFGRLLLMGLGFAIALGAARWMCFVIVFAGWFGFHALPLLQFLLF